MKSPLLSSLILGLAAITDHCVQSFLVSPSCRLTPPTLELLLRESQPESAERVDESSNNDRNDVEMFLKEEYGSFYSLLDQNSGIWDTLAKTPSTIFAPTNSAFTDLGETKLRQLRDIRNEEIVQKMGLYHVVLEDTVSAARLRTEDWTAPPPIPGAPRPITVRGLVTMGGELPVGRAKPQTGLLAGIMEGTGDIVIGPKASIRKSIKLNGGTTIVHEVDSLVSPDLLWRYCDQLQIRIPGF